MNLLLHAGLTGLLALFASAATAAELCPDNVVWDDDGSEVLSTCEDAGTHLLVWTDPECLFFGTGRVFFDRAGGWEEGIVTGDGFAVALASAGGSVCGPANAHVALNTLYTVQGPASTSTTVTVRVEAEVEVLLGDESCCGTSEATLSAFGVDASLQLDSPGTATEVLEITSSVQAGSTFVVRLEAFAQADPVEGASNTILNVVELLTDPGFTLERCDACSTVATPVRSWSHLKGRW